MSTATHRYGLPVDLGVIHFSGIGGIGMSGIAEILFNLGYKVQGSDASQNANVERLSNMGIPVHIGQKAENITPDIAVVVKSSAVKDTNPEIQSAREQKIPVIMRAEMLAEIMRLKASVAVAGTHGKTTTTSITTALFDAAGLDPTVINGGIINTYNTNAFLGQGDWLVAEADESDGSFLKLPATVGIITNIDPEHMEHYGSVENLHNAFYTFIYNLPFYGFAVLCKDHPVVAKLAERVTDRKIITYSMHSDETADVVACDIKKAPEGSTFNIKISDRLTGGARMIKNIFLPMPGEHNISNTLAAIGVGVELGFTDAQIRNGLRQFNGVKRRFTKTGEVGGVTIIDDYGHHPKEIGVTLKTAREVVGKDKKVIAVVQPHRYSRVRDFFDSYCTCVNDANDVVVTDIYAAGEDPIEGINKEAMSAGMIKEGKAKENVHLISSEEELPALIKKITSSGDIVVCLGAGTISLWANRLPEALKKA